MTDPKTPPSSTIGHSISATNASTGVENAAAEDLDCLQAALADWKRERAALLERSHAVETEVQGKLQHAELRFQRAVDQLEANKRSAHAVRVRLEADLQAARSRAQRAQEALAASQEVSERLRMANAELSTAMEAAQW